ncbi:hypothetical protein [Flavobacterium nitrogenifigens]|uniref:Uncharacterized protein n=1 Tax=Flavobacterium nitrogenifigens TaxID=1617283 RepID=A0A521FCA2_9FLAO|nr:hypothetical protein [Flavobacterium nitrogenifigens]KAF2337992.1 hypothetical protein DM397_03385 [Flavobacterium nitrogenifigens]SMO93130.1 hypothetical protein SAMN06265220_10826 [Flavobacterium nitrogenifigens]
MPIQTLNTIKKWFKTGLKPTQEQFWDTWDSFRHKNENVPIQDIENLETVLDAKAEKSELDNHTTNANAHNELFATKEDKTSKGIANGYAPLDEFSKITAQYLAIVNDLVTDSKTSLLSAQQGVVLKKQIDEIKNLLASDNANLNTVQKIVNYIEEIQLSLSNILINDLTTGGTAKALTAEMGKKLNQIKLTATIATDVETQISSAVAEDNKVVSRSKLFNWWKWVENTVLHKTGNETFTGVKTATNSGTTDVAGLSLSNEAGPGSKVFELINIQNGIGQRHYNYKNGVGSFGSNHGEGVLQVLNSLTESTGDLLQLLKNNVIKTRFDQNGRLLIRIGSNEIDKGINVTADGALGSKGIYVLTSTVSDGIVVDSVNSGIAQVLNSTGSYATGDLLVFRKNSITTSKFDQNGILTLPYLVIPSKTLVTTPVNGAIERDENGQLWETHNGVRSRLITASDDLILLAYKSPNTIQTNIAGAVSAIATNTSSSTIIGKIGNNSFLRLNALNEIYYPSENKGTVPPMIAKTEVFLKINNGLFASYYKGSDPVNQVKIMEFSGLNNNGFKNYQNPIVTNIQNQDPLIAQWSTIQLVVQTINNGTTTNADATYYLRDADNTRTFGANEASFSFVFVNTVVFADATNEEKLNTERTIRVNNYALYLETIR